MTAARTVLIIFQLIFASALVTAVDQRNFVINAIDDSQTNPNNNGTCKEENSLPAAPKFIVNIYSSGASVAECFGTIISQDTVLTASPCVFGFKPENIKVCTELSDSCPQNPKRCYTPKDVRILINYLNDLKSGFLSSPTALLKFESNFFKSSDVAPFDLSKACQCASYRNSEALTYDCVEGKGVVARKLLIDDFTGSAASRYGYVNPLYNVFYVEPKEAPYRCLSKLGGPLIVDGVFIGVNAYCQKNCKGTAYQVFFCYQPIADHIKNYQELFPSSDVFNKMLEELSLEERIKLRRVLRLHDETPECPRI